MPPHVLHSTQMQKDLDLFKLEIVKPIDQEIDLLIVFALIMVNNDESNNDYKYPFQQGEWTNGFGYIVGPNMASSMPFLPSYMHLREF